VSYLLQNTLDINIHYQQLNLLQMLFSYIILINFYNMKTTVLSLCQDGHTDWLKVVALLVRMVSHLSV